MLIIVQDQGKYLRLILDIHTVFVLFCIEFAVGVIFYIKVVIKYYIKVSL